MSIKDLVDALDGFENDTIDLSSKLKQKTTPSDLRHKILREKYANKFPGTRSKKLSISGAGRAGRYPVTSQKRNSHGSIRRKRI